MISEQTQIIIENCINTAKEIVAKYSGVENISMNVYNIPAEDIKAIDRMPQKFPYGSIMGLVGWELSGDIVSIYLYSGGQPV